MPLRMMTATVHGLARQERHRGTVYTVLSMQVICGNCVVWPSNAPGPEFVPFEVLSLAPESWNGRPATNDHPAEGSANSPAVLERAGLGLVFNARIEKGGLAADLYIDPARCKAAGADVLDRFARREPIEVSVGAWVLTEPATGTAGGKKYSARWVSASPDHVALLPAVDASGRPVRGACSTEMGCGIRAASERKETAMPCTCNNRHSALVDTAPKPYALALAKLRSRGEAVPLLTLEAGEVPRPISIALGRRVSTF